MNANCAGFKERSVVFEGSNVVFFSIVPFIDLASSESYLMPGHILSLSFERGKDSFCLLSTSDDNNAYKIKIHDLTLWARKLTPLPSILNTILSKMKTQPVYYPFTRNVLREYQFHAGSVSVEIPSLFRGRLPQSVYIFFLDNNQISGRINRNPYIFKNYDLMFANLVVSGYSFPNQALYFDFAKGDVVRG